MKTLINTLTICVWLGCCNVCQASAPDTLLPRWTVPLNGHIVHASLGSNWLVVTTGNTIYILNPEDGVVLDTFSTLGKTYTLVKKHPKEDRVWAVEKPNSGWQGTRVVEIDPIRDSVTRSIEFNTTPGPYPSTSVGSVSIDVSPDGKEIAILVSFDSDHYARLSDHGILYRYALDSLVQLEQSMSLNGWLEYHATDGALVVPGHTSSWAGDDYRGYRETWYQRTHVITFSDSGVKRRDTFNVSYRLGSNLRYLVGNGGPITWPDYRPVKNVALGKPHRGQDLLDFTVDACSQILVAPDPDDSIAADICELLTHDTLTRLKAYTKGKNWRYVTMARHERVLGTELDHLLHCWDISTSRKGRAGATPIVEPTVPERTYIRVRTPLTTPIDAPVDVKYQSIDNDIESDLFFAETIKTSRIRLVTESMNGDSWIDTQYVECVPLKHDLRSTTYWSVADAQGPRSSISADGRFVGIATNAYSVHIDLDQDAQRCRQEPALNTLRLAAVESDGSFYVVYDSLRSEGSNNRYSITSMTRRMRRYQAQSDSLDSKTFDYTSWSGDAYNGLFAVTRWREGFGCFITNVTTAQGDVWMKWCDNPRSLRGESPSVELCNTSPFVFDIDLKRTSSILKGMHERSAGSSDKYEWLKNYPEDSCNALSSQQDKYATYAGDGQYIVSDLAVYDRNFGVITNTLSFSQMPLDVPGTMNVISINGKTLYLWSLPTAVVVDSTVMDGVVTQVAIDTSRNAMLIQYANGTIELHDRAALFPVLDTIVVSVDNEDKELSDRSTGHSTLEVYTALGSLVHTARVFELDQNSTQEIRAMLGQFLPAGMYFTAVRYDIGKVVFGKVLIE